MAYNIKDFETEVTIGLRIVELVFGFVSSLIFSRKRLEIYKALYAISIIASLYSTGFWAITAVKRAFSPIEGAVILIALLAEATHIMISLSFFVTKCAIVKRYEKVSEKMWIKVMKKVLQYGFSLVPLAAIAVLFIVNSLGLEEDLSSPNGLRPFLALGLMTFEIIVPPIMMYIFNSGDGKLSGQGKNCTLVMFLGLGIVYAIVGMLVVPAVVTGLLALDAIKEKKISVKLRDLSSVIIPLPVMLVRVMVEMYTIRFWVDGNRVLLRDMLRGFDKDETEEDNLIHENQDSPELATN